MVTFAIFMRAILASTTFSDEPRATTPSAGGVGRKLRTSRGYGVTTNRLAPDGHAHDVKMVVERPNWE